MSKNAAERNKEGCLKAVGVQHPEFSEAIVFVEMSAVLRQRGGES